MIGSHGLASAGLAGSAAFTGAAALVASGAWPGPTVLPGADLADAAPFPASPGLEAAGALTGSPDFETGVAAALSAGPSESVNNAREAVTTWAMIFS